MVNPARKTTVTNVVQRPGTGSPIANLGVTIRLNVLGFADGGSAETVATRTVQTDADGRWSVELAANADIDPAGTYYTVKEGKGVIWSIVVPPAGSPVNLRDILVVDPANPSPMVAGVPLPGSGVPSGDVWITDGLGGGDYGSPSAAAGVTSFNTRTGVVSLTKTDVTGTGLAAADVGAATASALTSEAATARAAESTNATAIATEATTRGNAITTEAAARAAADALLIPLAQKGAANGVATLGSDGLVPTAQIPALALTTAVTVASQAAMLALTATQVQPGDIAVRTDGAGTFILTAVDPSVLGNWTRLNAPTDVVVSVNGQVGTVTLAASDVGAQPVDSDLTTIAALDATVAGALVTDGAGWIRKTYAQLKTALGLVKADVGLGSVDNTADASKPVSTLQAAADSAVQAFAIQRANHTGTQSADTIIDGTTNKVLSATDKTRLANTSGTNTGDQTITLTGDVTGSGTGSFAATLASVASAGTTGDASHSLTITIDAKGRVTAVTSNAIAIPESAVTGLVTDLAGKTSALTPTATKTATYTAVVGDLAMMNVPGGATVLNLPSAPVDKAQVGYVAIGATLAVPLTVNRGGSDTIGTAGATSFTVPLTGEAAVFQYNAANTRWLVVANFKSVAALDGRYLSPNPSLAGFNVFIDGHSYVTGTGSIGNNYGWAQRIAQRQSFSAVTNSGASGNFMVDAVMRYKTSGAVGSRGRLYILDCVINDVQNPSTKSTAKGLAGFQNSLLFYLVATSRISSRIEASAGAWSFAGGTWATDTTTTSGQYPTGNKYTTTQNDTCTVTVTVPAGAAGMGGAAGCWIMMWGLDDASSGITGAAFTISEGASLLVTGTTSNQYQKGGNGAGGASWAACPYLVWVPLAAGAHTLTIKKTDATGSRLWLQAAFLPPSTAAPAVWQSVIVKAFTGITFNSTTPTDISNYNNLVDTVVASLSLTDSSVIVVDPTAGPDGWVPATMLLSTDGLHPNQLGHTAELNAIQAGLNTLGYRSTVNVL